MSVYTHTGTYVGTELNSALWTLQGTVSSIPATDGIFFADIADFILPANTVTAFYVLGSNRISYSLGGNTYSNADIQITTGAAVANFAAPLFAPRTWNGTLYYDVNAASTAVPVPATLPLLAIGGAALVARRRKVA